MPSNEELESLAVQYARQQLSKALGFATEASKNLKKAVTDMVKTPDVQGEEDAEWLAKADAAREEGFAGQHDGEMTDELENWDVNEAPKRAPIAPQDEPEMVNHPKHYNNHPSEVECIDIAEVMEFNPGNAFKYVYRRFDKNSLEKDLQKAIWYCEREEARLIVLTKTPYQATAQGHIKWRSNNNYGLYHMNLTKKVLEAEPNEDARELYRLLFNQSSLERRVAQMKACVKLIELLLESSEIAPAGDGNEGW
jgi:hypothetical protein